jgi:uncharacterized protein YdaL
MIAPLILIRRRLIRALVLATALALALALVAAPARAQQGPPVLVLYDAPAGQAFEKLGRAYAIMLANLLGHWDAKLAVQPVQSYQAGAVESYQATFYLGSHYDNPLPQAFLQDVARTSRTVVWFRYNLWQLASQAGVDFAARFGFRWLGLRGLEGDPAAATPDFFDTVHYQGQALRKYYAFDAVGQRVFADPDLGLTEIVDPDRAQVRAQIENRATSVNAPYAIRAGNFWYVADIPFSYIGPRDRYLAVADLLHDMLGQVEPTASTPRALVRLEDVSAMTESSHLGSLARLFQDWQNPSTGAREPIPFSIALIGRYRDPLGVYNGGVAVDIRLRQAKVLRAALDDALARGGRLVMHGWTHQYSNIRNPWSAVSGDDFEFWDVVGNQVLPRDQLRDWRSYFDNAVKELTGAGYTAFAFETPHYQASPRAYRVSAERFRTAYERAFYYTADTPRLNVSTADRDFAVGQFFPYPLVRDWYGRKVLPENLGNIEYDISAIDPSSNIQYGWEELAINASVLRAVVRDGVASFFFHPFWLGRFVRPDGTVYPITALDDLKKLLASMQALGYRFVDPTTL